MRFFPIGPVQSKSCLRQMFTFTLVIGAPVTTSRNFTVTLGCALPIGGHTTEPRQPHVGSALQTESTHSAPANAGPRAAQSASTEHCCRLGSTMTLHAAC